jgi:hypothetical protein
MTYLNNELSLARLDTVSGGGGIFGSFFPAILTTKEPKPSNPGPTTSPGLNTGDHVSTGGYKSGSFDPVAVRF